MDYFERSRPAHGAESVAIELGPICLSFAGFDEQLATDLHERYAPYSLESLPAGRGLTVDVEREETDYFIDPVDPLEFAQVRIACDGDRVRYLSYQAAGWFDVSDGRGRLVLARGTFEPAERSVENFVRAAVAWQAASRGGALVHAASAVLDDRAYLFYGESGAGKSTLSANNRRAAVVSDDLSLVLPDGSGTLHVVGSPFRGTYEGGDPVLGAYPLRAGFRLIQAPVATVRSVPRLRAMAELIGNLPFVAEEFDRRPDLFDALASSFAPIPLAHLHFLPDDSYWDAIATAGLLD